MGARAESSQLGTSSARDALKHLRFRNYTPRDDELKKYQEEAIDPEQLVRDMVEQQDRMLMEAARNFADPKRDAEDIVPRSVNWELRRLLAPRLKKLRDKTDLAIIDLNRKKEKADESSSILKAVADMEAQASRRESTQESETM